MIYKVINLYDEGKGLSQRKIAKKLAISRNTVKKILEKSHEEISEYMENREREKRLDLYRNYMVSLLKRYDKMSATKIKRKCEEKGTPGTISERTYRRFVNALKQEIPVKQLRNYEPVIDMLPGIQCQVDPGEINTVVSGKSVKIYFCVFVLSYSRLMYVSLSDKPINTSRFIEMHNEAFNFFGGVPEECVYDQTKLVVIKEQYREVWFNEAFSRYASSVNFYMRVCEGYDPESKGKVEAGVKYVKNNFFYGEEFRDLIDMMGMLDDWLREVANVRIHGTHKRKPIQMYEAEEREYMNPFLKPSYLDSELDYETRKVDKTSLISYKSNKYSVPYIYQNHVVCIKEESENLIVMDSQTKTIITTHRISYKTGKVNKNRNHYRDHEKTVQDRENEVLERLGERICGKICSLLKQSNPKIYKDQLVGLLTIIQKYTDRININDVFSELSEKPYLTASRIENYLEAHVMSVKNEKDISENEKYKSGNKLSKYMSLTMNDKQNKSNSYVNL